MMELNETLVYFCSLHFDSFFQFNLILIHPVLLYAFTTGLCSNLKNNNLKPTIMNLGVF